MTTPIPEGPPRGRHQARIGGRHQARMGVAFRRESVVGMGENMQPGSAQSLRGFVRRLQRLWMHALRRRSQRHCFDWKKLEHMTEILWPRVSIRHPWPDRRFAVKYSK